MVYFRRFWVKEPRHSETISSDEKCHLYRSTRLKLLATTTTAAGHFSVDGLVPSFLVQPVS